jgi:hypothetical protein
MGVASLLKPCRQLWGGVGSQLAKPAYIQIHVQMLYQDVYKLFY